MMSFAYNNGTNPLHEDRQSEQGMQDDPSRSTDTDTACEPSQALDVHRGPGRPRIRTQHCILCLAETVGACLICHRPLCEQCGRSDDEFLRCPMHHQDEVEELRSTLRQAVLAVIGTKHYVTDLLALRNRVLHEVSAALLRSYVERVGAVPSPAQVQQMRRVAVALWNSLACLQEGEEPVGLEKERAARQQEHEEDERAVDQTGQQEMRLREEEEPR